MLGWCCRRNFLPDMTRFSWCWVQLPEVSSSRIYLLDPELHYLLQAHDFGLCIEFEAVWQDELRHNVTIALDYSKWLGEDCVFGFHQYRYESVLRLTPKLSEVTVLGLSTWITTVQYIVSNFFEELIASRCYFNHKQCQTDFSLLHSNTKQKTNNVHVEN